MNGVTTYLLQESDGTIEHFNRDGTLDYIQDADGNRITAAYASGQLASLTSSSGGSLTISYNTAGLIKSVAGSNGTAVTYGYDATNSHLVSARQSNGQTTRYVYNSGSNPAVQNALTTITNPDGTHEYFTYNAIGQLLSMSQNGGADKLSFGYAEGEVTVTDAAGDVSAYYYDDSGNLLKYVDPIGNASYATYNSNGQVTSVTGPTGLTSTYSYNAQGNLTGVTNPLGQTTSFTYSGTLLSSMTNAQGDTTNYQYNSQGDLTAVQYPDSSVESATYDALGDPLTLTNRDGQATSFTYNADGQVASVTLTGGSPDHLWLRLHRATLFRRPTRPARSH